MKELPIYLSRIRNVALIMSPFLFLFVLALLKPLFIQGFTRETPVAASRLSESKPGLSRVLPRDLNNNNSVLTPISIVDDAFRDVKTNKGKSGNAYDGTPGQVRPETGVGVAETESHIKETGTAEQSATGHTEKQPDSVQDSGGSQKDMKYGPAVEVTGGRTAEKTSVPETKSNAESDNTAGNDVYIKKIEEIAADNGLSQQKTREMVRSFVSLSNMMLKKEAWKVVMMRIRNESQK